MTLIGRVKTSGAKDFVLTLDDVLTVYREALGMGALIVNGFFRRVVRTVDGTAAIGKDGTFYYCPDWFNEYVTTPGRLRDIIMHELMHPVLGDMSRDMGDMPNIAGDAVINAMLYTLGLSPCELMRDMSSHKLPHCLLRPESTPPPEARGIYASLYPGRFYGQKFEQCQNPLELLQALQVLHANHPFETSDVMLLGSHQSSLPTQTEDGVKISEDVLRVPGEIIGDIAEICEERAEAVRGGEYGQVAELTYAVIKSRRRIRTELLKGFECKNKQNKLKQYFRGVRNTRSVVPTTVTRTEASRIVMGSPPLFYKRKLPTDMALARQGIAWYLDVSGSVSAWLPQVIGFFLAVQDDISSVWQFSNAVREMPKDDFIRGKIQTTGGTDFNCVIDHAVEQGFRKVLILTDGCADADPTRRQKARQHIDRMGLVYFGSYSHVDWIEEQYRCHFKLSELMGETEALPGSKAAEQAAQLAAAGEAQSL